MAADASALAQTLAGIAQKAGTRLGNVAPVLYAMAKTPGLYTQPDGGADTWERETGLGVVDLKILAQFFPRGTVGTSSLLVASNYAPYHGKSLTLTATVTSTGRKRNPDRHGDVYQYTTGDTGNGNTERAGGGNVHK